MGETSMSKMMSMLSYPSDQRRGTGGYDWAGSGNQMGASRCVVCKLEYPRGRGTVWVGRRCRFEKGRPRFRILV